MKANMEQRGKITSQCFIITKAHFNEGQKWFCRRSVRIATKFRKTIYKTDKIIWSELTDRGSGSYKTNKKQPRSQEKIGQ